MIIVYKPVGISPLDCIKKIQSDSTDLVTEKLSYAGRLDPMAEGLVLMLVGDENKDREKYLKLDKQYEVEIIFGIETDSYDVLGLPKKGNHQIEEAKVKEVLTNFVGPIEQSYPPFSSKTYRGKPLYWWMRQGRIHDVVIPKEKRNIYDLRLISFSEISHKHLKQEIKSKLLFVRGDFRQEEILKSWDAFLHHEKESRVENYFSARLSVHCSSGTYIRTLTHDIGQRLKTGAFVFSLVRTAIGDYKKPDLDLRSNIFQTK